MQSYKEIREEAMKRPCTLSEEELARRQQDLEDWRAICAFEDIIPDEDMRLDDDLLIQGKMTLEEYAKYLRLKIKQKYQS